MSAHPRWSVWGEYDLSKLKEQQRAGMSLTEISRRQGVPAAACDLAAWALIGRTIDEAVIYLNGGKS